MKNARHLDVTTVLALQNLHEYLQGTGRHLLISGSNQQVTAVLRRSGLLAQIGPENVFPAEVNPTAATRRALKRANQLLPQATDVRLFYEQLQDPEDGSLTEYEI